MKTQTFKDKFGYETASAEDKEVLDGEIMGFEMEDGIFYLDEDETRAGYSDMSDAEKISYLTDQLTWRKAVFEICQANILAVRCQHNETIRRSVMAKRKEGGFFGMELAE